MLYEMPPANQSQHYIMDFCGSWNVFIPSTKPASSPWFNLCYLFFFIKWLAGRGRHNPFFFWLIQCHALWFPPREGYRDSIITTRNKEGEKWALFCEDIWVCELWRKKRWVWSQSPGASCHPPAGLPEAGVFLPEITLGATSPCHPSYQGNIFEPAFLL